MPNTAPASTNRPVQWPVSKSPYPSSMLQPLIQMFPNRAGMQLWGAKELIERCEPRWAGCPAKEHHGLLAIRSVLLPVIVLDVADARADGPATQSCAVIPQRPLLNNL